MPAPARMPAMSAPVRASCFGLGVGGAGVEGVAAARGVAELGVEGVDGVGVADGVGSAEGVDVTGGVSIGVCTTRSFLATCYRRVGPPCVQFPRLVVARSRHRAAGGGGSWSPEISHAIPVRVFQGLKSDC